MKHISKENILINFRIILSFFVALILLNVNGLAQKTVKDNETGFYFDVLTFKSDTSVSSKMDCFIVVPYQYLKFNSVDKVYYADFEIVVKLFDSLSNKIGEKRIPRKIYENDYQKVQGAYSGFDYVNASFIINKGNYKVDTEIMDNNSANSYIRSRNVAVLNFDDYPFSLSGMLLLSSIEEQNGKMLITPFLSDNISDLPDGFFVFFESYNKVNYDKIDYVYKLFNEKNELLFTSDKISKPCKQGKQQNYLNIQLNKALKFGNFILRVFAYRPSDSKELSDDMIIAASEKSLKFVKTIGGMTMDNIDLAITQSFYAASNSDFDYMKAAESEQDKYYRFSEFWSKMDPTPGTDRNEAFDEYFSRVKYASEKFGKLGDGWKSDMGKVYIIFGEPYSTDRSSSNYKGQTYEKWTYMGNRAFIFVDNNGFGDYRLYQPMSVPEKYIYSGNR